MHLKKWRIRLIAGVMAMLLGVSMIRPAKSLEIQTEPTEPAVTETVPETTGETGADETTVQETVAPTDAITETTPAVTQPQVTNPPQTEPQETEAQQPEPQQPAPQETESQQTEPQGTDPIQTEPQQTHPIEPILDEELPTEATEPPPDAGAQDEDLGVVSGQGITFKLFNYNLNINKAAGNSAWRPISSYFTFRNSLMEAGVDASAVNIPSPNCNGAHDQDGFTKHHATVERVLSGGLPVLDLTRNADGTSRTDPGVGSAARSLAYLFSAGDHAVSAYSPRNTILQRSGSHYWYNSAAHAVDYDTENNLFRLRSYSERNSTTSGYGGAYGDFLPFTYTGGTEIGSEEDGTPYHVLAEDTDYWFGMTMTVNFFQTKGGKLGDQDMIFSFSGDDDVWVFVDDVLVLDLGGTHGTADGSINFATGEVLQYLSWGGANSSAEARTGGSSTSFPTTIRACFDAAGRTPSGGWSADGKTFADFTEHTLKFFYLERGSAVANCMLDFRLPTLPDESLTVTKDIVADSDSELRDFIADSLSYSFRVMKADAAGNATGEHFITAGMTYDLLESGSKIGTGTVGDDGCFRLKAGQSAQFTQMLYKGNGATTYVVEEIMPDELTGQYGGVEYLVSGAGGETITEEMEAEAFTAFRTGLLSAEQTQTVTFRNRVDTSKLCKLSVTKKAAPGTQIPPDSLFQIQVKLGGKLLAAGSTYAVDGAVRTVETAGILLLHSGETVVLQQGILSGTAYEIAELGAEQAGYRPAYTGTVQPDGDMTISANGVMGTFPLAGEVHVTVTNADYDFAVEIPIQKMVLAFQESNTFRFKIEQVEPSDGNWNVIEELPESQITVTGTQSAQTVTTIGYGAGTEGVFYYRISELPSGEAYIDDRSFYIAEVITTGDGAQVTGIYKNGSTETDSLSFVNRAAAHLTVTKTVTGITGSMKFPFTAKVFLGGEPFALPQPNTGAAYAVNGNVISFSLAHGESITIPYIPIGAVVVVEEHQNEGFEVSSRVIGSDEPAVSGSQREIVVSNTAAGVEFINQSGYRLPNTGGGVSHMYTTGCAALCAGLCAAVLYCHFGRRKEENASS